MMIQPVSRQHEPSESAAKRHQNKKCDRKCHRQHAGARISQPSRPSREYIYDRRDNRDQIRDLRIIRKNLPFAITDADSKSQNLQYDDQYICKSPHHLHFPSGLYRIAQSAAKLTLFLYNAIFELENVLPIDGQPIKLD